MDRYTHESVINLSDHQLTLAEISLLAKGLSFCPTPGEPMMGNLREDLDKFHLSLKRTAFFASLRDFNSTNANDTDTSILDSQATEEDWHDASVAFKHPKFKRPSTFDPDANSPTLGSFIDANQYDLAQSQCRAPHVQNLTKEEKSAIRQLSSNHDIVIKPADKGSGIVIMNTPDYLAEGHRQLSDPKYYMKVQEDQTGYFNSEVGYTVDQMVNNGEIDTKCAEYLFNDNPRTSLFYMLPKIHKGKIPPPGRPIVSAIDSPTDKISQFVDFFLQESVALSRSYIRDSQHFVKVIDQQELLHPSHLLVTLDVTSLYTNIPNTEGCFAATRALTKSRPGAQHPTNQSLVNLTKLVLSKNAFAFNNEFYVQTGGTAMGTKMAPSYANIFMSSFEDKFVYTYPLQATIWLRYIDDIFMIWPHGEDELNKFVTHLNSCHNTIKFTTEVSKSHTNFLDTTVFVAENRSLKTRLYCKPTDTHDYLLYNSCHPAHCKEGIPYSQFLRIRRICTDIADFEISASMLTSHFTRRKYPDRIITDAIERARSQDRHSLLYNTNVRNDNSEKRFYIIDTYNPSNPNLKCIIKNNWGLLAKSIATRDLHSKKVIFGHRRPKNLKDLLVRARLPSPSKRTNLGQSGRISKCPDGPNCEYCTRLDMTGRITSKNRNRTYTSKYNIDCAGSNVIYCIHCTRCGEQYVGQTKRESRERFYEHFLAIRQNSRRHSVSRHFNSHDHQGLKDVKLYIVDFIHKHPENKATLPLRLHIEKQWIHRLRTIAPYGLNIKD